MSRGRLRAIYVLVAVVLGVGYHLSGHSGWEMPGFRIDGTPNLGSFGSLLGFAPERQASGRTPVKVTLTPYSGRVVAVHDGDTLTVLDADRQQHKIRLAEMDAPELAQPYGQTAKQALSSMVYGKNVQLRPEDEDRYGRTVAMVEVSNTNGVVNINRAMVAGGHAWVYRTYLHDRSLLDDEALAREQKRGLWALQPDQRQAPWEFRKEGREERAER